jgi:RimJ/RimL family protein N-acetyltransferase
MAGDVSYHAVYHGPNPGSRAFNVGIALLPEHRGRGLGAEAQRQLAAYLFAHTRVERLEASTDVDNAAEQRALDKAGFTREGVLRSAQYRDGGFHDLVLYSRVRSDRPSQG